MRRRRGDERGTKGDGREDESFSPVRWGSAAAEEGLGFRERACLRCLVLYIDEGLVCPSPLMDGLEPRPFQTHGPLWLWEGLHRARD